MYFGSVFHFSGNPQGLKMRVVLEKKQIAVLPNIGSSNEIKSNIESSTIVDDTTVQWQQKISLKDVANNQEESRLDKRIFTLVDGEPLNTTEPQNSQPPSETSQLRKWLAKNPFLDLPTNEVTKQPSEGKKKMHIMIDLGEIGTGKRNPYTVCAISLINDRTFLFEPPLTSHGYRIESKLGDYVANVQVLDQQFSSLVEHSTGLSQLPDFDLFEVEENGYLRFLYNMTIVSGVDFPFDGIHVTWELIANENVKCTGTSTGRTAKCFEDKDGQLKYSHAFELMLSIPYGELISEISHPKILFHAISQDYWGRQWTAGYGSIVLPKSLGRKCFEVNCWRPVSRNQQNILKDFFIGDAIGVNYKEIVKSGKTSLLDLETESTGRIFVNIDTIIHGRHLMTKDTLHQMKYGAMLGKIGVKSDLYWRIMKVLMEFEEARRELLRVRGAQSLII